MCKEERSRSSIQGSSGQKEKRVSLGLPASCLQVQIECDQSPGYGGESQSAASAIMGPDQGLHTLHISCLMCGRGLCAQLLPRFCCHQ